MTFAEGVWKERQYWVVQVFQVWEKVNKEIHSYESPFVEALDEVLQRVFFKVARNTPVRTLNTWP
jgi:hypothetical protein